MSRKRRGRPGLSPVAVESIRQIYLLTGNKTEVARRLSVSVPTVNKYLAQMEAETNDPDLRTARQSAHNALAGKIAVKATELIESITPETMQTHRVVTRNSDGEITAVREYGPTLPQKTIAIGILVDKAKVLREIEGGMRDDTNSGQLPLPQTVAALVFGLQSRIKSISVLNIQMAPEQRQTLDRAQEVLVEAEIAQAEGPRVLDFDDFDPKPTH